MTSGQKTRRKPGSKPFTLTVGLEDPRITLSVKRSLDESDDRKLASQKGSFRLVTLKGQRARMLMPFVLDAVHKSGRSVKRIAASQGGRTGLTEERGARLALLLLAAFPIQKSSRASVIRSEIASMSDEEVYYWYAKAVGGEEESLGQLRGNALKALRILMAGE